jgi:hypothetical protein
MDSKTGNLLQNIIDSKSCNKTGIDFFREVSLDLSEPKPEGRAQCGHFNQIMITLKRRRKIKSAPALAEKQMPLRRHHTHPQRWKIFSGAKTHLRP